MRKTISGFLLPECVHVSCAHTHTHTLPVYVKRFFWPGQPSAFLSSSGIRLGHVLVVTIHLAGRWGVGVMEGQSLACPQHSAQHLASSCIHSLLSLPSSVLGLPVWPGPPSLPSPGSSPVRVFDSCVSLQMQWGRARCLPRGQRALMGRLWSLPWSKLVVREDGAGRLESLHNGVRRAVLGRKVGSWIVGMAVAKKKKWDGRSGEGRAPAGKCQSAQQTALIKPAKWGSTAKQHGCGTPGSRGRNQDQVLCFYDSDIVKSGPET